MSLAVLEVLLEASLDAAIDPTGFDLLCFAVLDRSAGGASFWRRFLSGTHQPLVCLITLASAHGGSS